jgi:plastocyanin
MFRTKLLFSAFIAGGLTLAFQSGAQTPAASPHVITVNLIERPGAKPFAFDPLNFTAQRGDTLRFVQGSSTMHNVHFKTQPKGAKLGSTFASPYLTKKGQTFTVVIDSRFADGTYEVMCDPHESIGMHAFLTVKGQD